VKKLVLVHQGHELACHGPMEKALGEMAEFYKGTIIWGEELMEVGLS
jgi:hypothetical protein